MLHVVKNEGNIDVEHVFSYDSVWTGGLSKTCFTQHKALLTGSSSFTW